MKFKFKKPKQSPEEKAEAKKIKKLFDDLDRRSLKKGALIETLINGVVTKYK